MAKTDVIFERVLGTGIAFSSIKVNDTLLLFENDKCTRSIDSEEAFEIYWRIQGEPRAKLTIKYVANGEEKVAVETKIPANKSKHTAFKFITL